MDDAFPFQMTRKSLPAAASAVALTYVLLMIWFGLRAKMPAHRRWSIVLTILGTALIVVPPPQASEGTSSPVLGAFLAAWTTLASAVLNLDEAITH